MTQPQKGRRLPAEAKLHPVALVPLPADGLHAISGASSPPVLSQVGADGPPQDRREQPQQED